MAQPHPRSGAPDPATASPARAALPAHILIVEDDAVMALMLEGALHDAGVAAVEICSTTECALETLRDRRPEAIVIDVHLADSDDGWAIAELLHTLGPDSPRIVFSTGAPGDIPAHIASLGQVLVKPYLVDQLLDALATPQRPGLFARLRGAIR